MNAEGLLKRLKDESHDTSPRGVFRKDREPMKPAKIAQLCALTPDELQAVLPELLSVHLVAYDKSGALMVPEIVRQETERLKASKAGKKGGNPSLKIDGPLRDGLRGGVKLNDNDLTSGSSVVVKDVVFTKPTKQQLLEYSKEIGYELDVDNFLAYYEANGWKVKRNNKLEPMVSWQLAVNTWKKRDRDATANRAAIRKLTDGMAQPI